MNLIYYSITVLLLLLNVGGLTAVMRRWLPSYALARAAGLLMLCTTLFFVEHFQGLGKLDWLWPFTTIVAAALMYKKRRTLCASAFWRAERVFFIAFAYGFAWKWAFPIIYPSSERVTDLYFIGNYLSGQTLPPLDNWYPPHRFDFYYGFQHYAAALMGRILGLGPGLTYNLAFALLMALPITLVWDFTQGLLKQSWKRWLIVITFVIGGTGTTPFVHLGYDFPTDASAGEKSNVASETMWASPRFIGLFDQRLNTEFAENVFPSQAKPDWEPRELPLEGFGYQFFVGDYHPPLGGFFLLMLAIACIGNLERDCAFLTRAPSEKSNAANGETRAEKAGQPGPDFQPRSALQALLAFTVPLTIATNTWVFPLQAALVLGWVVWSYLNGKPPTWKALLAGGGAGLLLLYPFLSGFAANALPTPIKWVRAEDHTPVVSFLAMHWPLLLFGVLSLFSSGSRRVALLFSAVFLGLLLVSECIFVDDPTGGKYERTNTVMKWWGWIWSGGLVTLAATLLGSRIRWIQGAVVLALLSINWYAQDIARYWLYTDKSSAGKLAAHSVYTGDPIVRDQFDFLLKAPSGIVLENNYGGAYTESGIYAVFAAKPSLLGWPLHVQTWHGSIGQGWLLNEQIIRFYKGELPNAADWLLANNVEYIVWNAHDALQADAWEPINNTIDHVYAWHEFNSDPSRPIGLWIRRTGAR